MSKQPVDDPSGCPAEVTLDFLAGKWRPMIIYWLLQCPLRFNELQRRLGTVSHRTLSKTLKDMETGGLVIRRDYGEIPPRVDYSLTPRGRSLEPILRAMERWAQDQRQAKTVSGPMTGPTGSMPPIESERPSQVEEEEHNG